MADLDCGEGGVYPDGTLRVTDSQKRTRVFDLPPQRSRLWATILLGGWTLIGGYGPLSPLLTPRSDRSNRQSTGRGEARISAAPMARPLSVSLQEYVVPWQRTPWPIPWAEIFGRTAPTETNIDDYLGHQDRWPETTRPMTPNQPGAPVTAGLTPTINLGPPMTEKELPYFYMLGMLRRGLGGSLDLRRPTKESEADWFADAGAVLHRVAELFNGIGRRGPSPHHVMRQKDLDDAKDIYTGSKTV